MLSSIASGISKLAVSLKGTPTQLADMTQFLHEVNTSTEKATFGMGCFWSCDSLYGAVEGVVRTRVGYSGGTFENPSYKNLGDHTEVIEIDFDPKVVTYSDLLYQFWNNHEYGLTTKLKRQYMSIVLYHNEEQKELAEKSMQEESDKRKETLITEIIKAGTFYPAEDYHQKYRLQGHKDLMASIGLTPDVMLQTSHLAARLNGYLVGQGGIDQFNKEAEKLGLSPKQMDYVRQYIKKHEGNGLFC